MAQVGRLGPKVVSQLALLCIHAGAGHFGAAVSALALYAAAAATLHRFREVIIFLFADDVGA